MYGSIPVALYKKYFVLIKKIERGIRRTFINSESQVGKWQNY